MVQWIIKTLETANINGGSFVRDGKLTLEAIDDHLNGEHPSDEKCTLPNNLKKHPKADEWGYWHFSLEKYDDDQAKERLKEIRDLLKSILRLYYVSQLLSQIQGVTASYGELSMYADSSGKSMFTILMSIVQETMRTTEGLLFKIWDPIEVTIDNKKCYKVFNHTTNEAQAYNKGLTVQKQFKNKYKLSKDAIKAIEEQSNNFEVNSLRVQENKIKVMSEILNYLKYKGATHSAQYTELETALEKLNKASNNYSMDNTIDNDASRLTQARANTAVSSKTELNDIESKRELISTSRTDEIGISATPKNSEQVPTETLPASTIPHQTFSRDDMPSTNAQPQTTLMALTTYDERHLSIAYSVQKILDPSQSDYEIFTEKLRNTDFCHGFHRRIYEEALVPYQGRAGYRLISWLAQYSNVENDMLIEHHSRLKMALSIITTQLPKLKEISIEDYNLELGAINICLSTSLSKMCTAMPWHVGACIAYMSKENPCKILNQWPLNKLLNDKLEFASLSAQIVMKNLLVPTASALSDGAINLLNDKRSDERNEFQDAQDKVNAKQEIVNAAKITAMNSRTVLEKVEPIVASKTQISPEFFKKGGQSIVATTKNSISDKLMGKQK